MQHAPVTAASAARALMEAGERPAPAQVVDVKLEPGGKRDHTITLEVVYDGQPLQYGSSVSLLAIGDSVECEPMQFNGIKHYNPVVNSLEI